MMQGDELNMALLRRIALRAAFCVCLLCGMLVFMSVPAFGAQTRELLQSFGSLSGPRGLAVDSSSGNVYVADTGAHSIQTFTSEGVLLFSFGKQVNKTAMGLSGSEAEQDVCTALSGNECQAGAAGTAPGEFTTPEFIAVDNDSSSPSFGDVYVADPGDGEISKFTSQGVLVSHWGSSGQLDGSLTAAGAFGAIAGIGTGSDGVLYVMNTANVVFEFTESGVASKEVVLEAGGREVVPIGLGVSPVGALFKSNGDGSIEKFDATGKDVGEVTAGISGSQPAATAFGIDPEGGDLYVVTVAGVLQHYAFNGSGEVLQAGGSACLPEPLGIHGCGSSDSVSVGFAAVGVSVANGGSALYLSDADEGAVDKYGPFVTVAESILGAASNVAVTEVQLNGDVNPGGLELTECAFEYVTRAAYDKAVSEKAANQFVGATAVPCVESPNEIGAGSTPVAVHAEATNLSPHTEYEVRLKAANVEAVVFSDSRTFSTLPLPAIESEKVEALTPTSAELVARINPRGSEAKYHFEFDTREYLPEEAAHGTSVPLPDATLPAGTSPEEVRVKIDGLSAETKYHWRIAATNESGSSFGKDNLFIYEAPSGLPDHRKYEMVTPPHKNGALIGDVSFLGSVPDLAANGSRVIASSIQCFDGSVSCNAQQTDGIGSPFEFDRTSTGWDTTPLAPSSSEYASIAPWASNATSGYTLFSMPTPPIGENDFYIRAPDGSLTDMGPNTPPEEGAQRPIGGKINALSQAATPDFSHFMWRSGAKWAFDGRNPHTVTTYEYAGVENTEPLMVGVTGGRGSHDQISACGTGAENIHNAMSADGRTIFFTALPCAGGTGANAGVPVSAATVYARIDGETAAARTESISQPTPSECGSGAQMNEVQCRAAAGAPSGSKLVGASTDGSKALFLSTQQLTDIATEDHNSGDSDPHHDVGCASTVSTGCNLYEYDFANAASHKLIDVSAGDSSGGGPRVEGVMAVSEDDSHVYFVAGGVLTPNANARGQHAESGMHNLYLFERDSAHPNGAIVFIVSLPSVDAAEWTLQPGKPANVTPDGKFLVFVSHGDLTADDTSLSGADQVFRFDADTGGLIRISVGNEGFNNNGNATSPSPCLQVCSEDAMIVQSFGFPRIDPTMSDDGAYVFFQSPLALAAGALNDASLGTATGEQQYAQNVYEWHEGHVFLITTGSDDTANNGGSQLCVLSSVCLFGTDASGENVLFSTVEPLVGADRDTELDYYDARICTAESPCLDQDETTEESCKEDGCQGSAVSPPTSSGPASAAFGGAGNIPRKESKASTPSPARPKPPTKAQSLAKALKSCRAKHNKRERGACERQARKRYSPKNSRRRSSRRAKSLTRTERRTK